MSHTLVDSSVWIDYFAGKTAAKCLDQLFDTNLVCTNQLILSELIPFLLYKKENDLIDLLLSIRQYELDVDWSAIRTMQTANLNYGINGVGIPDLIILQNVMQHNLELLTSDSHFSLMHQIFSFRLALPGH